VKAGAIPDRPDQVTPVHPAADEYGTAVVLLLDQGAEATRARDELDWDPSHLSLTEEFRQGNYRS
jgi:hypothetical protein